MGLKLNKKPLGQEDGSADKSAYHKNLMGSVQSSELIRKKERERENLDIVVSPLIPALLQQQGRQGELGGSSYTKHSSRNKEKTEGQKVNL